MFPHPNPLPRWLKPLFWGAGALLLFTGLLWLWLHYRYGTASAEGLPHPAEHPLIQAHGLAALLFTLALGALGPVHVPRGWREGRNKRSGLLLITSAALLLASGYALYYFTSEEWRPWVGGLHAGVGSAMALVVGLHAKWRQKAA